MEEWKDKVIRSLSGIERAKPPTDGFEGIRRKLAARSRPNAEKGGQWMAVAAAILILVSSNALLLTNHSNKQQVVDTAEAYPEMITSFNIYDNEQ
ncbi:MAG: hypothetical protein RIF33_23565 [Cyclobacteriaceae bacterium]